MGNTFFPTHTTKEEFFQSAPRKDSNRNSFFGGSLGLGDPEDKFLFRKEIRLGLPAKRREIILDEYCSKPNQDYLDCREQNTILGRFRCRTENLHRTSCVRQFWDLPGLEERAYNEYLAARSHFRQTGDSQFTMSKWEERISLPKPTWEQYQKAQKDDRSVWEIISSEILKLPQQSAENEKSDRTVWSIILNFWKKQTKPDVSVPKDCERLNDS